MLDLHEVALDPEPADLGFVSKGQCEYIRRSSIHRGGLSVGPVLSGFSAEALPIGPSSPGQSL